MSATFFQKAVAACEKPYSEAHEKAAADAVQAWLKEEKAGSNTKVDEYKSVADGTKTMLLVASEKGYPKVVQQLLEDEELVKVEVDDRAKELFLKYIQEGNARAAPRSGFVKARNELRAKKGAAKPSPRASVEDYPEGKRTQAKESARYKSCYDMITLYMYIGEEILDAPTLIGFIWALRDLKWTSIDEIATHWDTVRKELSRYDYSKVKVLSGDDHDGSWIDRVQPTPSALLDQLSEARYNYDGNPNPNRGPARCSMAITW